MPKSMVPFLTTFNKGDIHHMEFPTFQVIVNVLNATVLQEILKVPGVDLVDLTPITRPPAVEINPKEAPVKKAKVKSKHASPFKHPSGKTSSDLIMDFMSQNGGTGIFAELKRHLKTQGFSPDSVSGAVTKLIDQKKIKRIQPRGYALVSVEETT